MNPFTQPVEDLAQTLGTSQTAGLSEDQAAENARKFGVNQFTKEKPRSLAGRMFDAAREPMILILIIAGVITVAVNIIRLFQGSETDFVECVGIFTAIFIAVTITVVMEGRSAKAFEALSKISEKMLVKVIRGGGLTQLPQKEIVVGDVLVLETGDKIPADARLFEAHSLEVDEAPLTGESLPVKKDASVIIQDEKTPLAERVNMLYSGCFVTAGNGTAIVTAVGDSTEFGQIAQELAQTEKSSTPLQEKLARLGKTITLMGSSAAAIVFLIQLILSLVRGGFTIDGTLEIFITSIVLIVAAVPEGLPTIVAISLALSVIKMARQNALVKRMIACETVGCIHVICSDKTGTLTENKMSVTQMYANGALIAPNDLRDHWIIQNICVNSSAGLEVCEDGGCKTIGSPTECALLAVCSNGGAQPELYIDRRRQTEIVRLYPFSSDQKRMLTAVRENGQVISYVKGAPEYILALCAMDKQERETLLSLIGGYQNDAKRVLAFAHKQISDFSDLTAEREQLESMMIFDGFAVIADPVRADVPDAVRRAKAAGIDVKILTGDNIATAKAIARELNLIDNDAQVRTAAELDEMSDAELAAVIADIRVIARSTPLTKLRIVKTLRRLGNVVAVTGDGVNDAPAIKNADVGIAMGITGTEVSKEASDMVLLDDSFSTIVKAVQWGRGIYENFQRFIQFQLTVNLSAVITVLVSILLGFRSPFSALQLLWINIIMDGPPALTLGLEPIRADLLGRSPTLRSANILSTSMLKRIFLNGIYISAVFLWQTTGNFLGGTAGQQETILFTLFVLFQLFNAFNARELSGQSIFRNFSSNRMMLLVFGTTFFLQVLITQIGGAFFGTVPLPLNIWVKLTLCASTVILVSELFKLAANLLRHKYR